MAEVIQTPNPASYPLAKPSREEIAKREIGHTIISRSLAWYLLVLFLASIYTVPIVQYAIELRLHALGNSSTTSPRIYDAIRFVPDAVAAFSADNGSWIDRTLAANRRLADDIHTFETRLEDDSAFVQAVLPPTQFVLTRFFNVGNDKTYIGRDGWLFYAPDIEYTTNLAFLSPHHSDRRRGVNSASAAPQPDPLQAICQFHAQLAGRGIRLVVMPTPPKPTIYPEKFSDKTASTAPLHNPSYLELISNLREKGVLVFDPTDTLMEAKRANVPAFLATDTHWTPPAMESVAGEFARWLMTQGLLPDGPPFNYRRQAVSVTGLGDVAKMLQLPKRPALHSREKVIIQQVTDARQALWKPTPSSDVLVLGDSFCNIFSTASMGWGKSAGFVEQLSYHLQRPLDQIIQNDGGAFATRQSLSRALARGEDRLAGKRVVVWQFAARELAFGNWKLLDIASPAAPRGGFFVAPTGEVITVRGVIKTISPAPQPGSVPYKDHLVCAHLTDMSIDRSPAQPFESNGSQCIVYLWSMQDNIRQPAARLRPGQTVVMRMRPWSDVAADYGTINRTELDDFELQLEEPNWGELVQ